MNTFILLLLIITAVGFFLFLVSASTIQDSDEDQAEAGGSNPKVEVWPYYAKRLLSQPEQILYNRLVQALPDHLVFPQVQLSRFLGVKKGHPYMTWFNRINRMSADFVICNKDSSIVAVIELDDSSHERQDRQVADAKKDKALADAGIPIVRWNVKSFPEIATIQEKIHSLN